MTTEEIIQLPIGTKVYLIENARILSFNLLSPHPDSNYSNNYYYMISRLNVNTVKAFYIPNSKALEWEIDYDKAKEIMWNQVKKQVQSLNEIYMKGEKKYKFEK